MREREVSCLRSRSRETGRRSLHCWDAVWEGTRLLAVSRGGWLPGECNETTSGCPCAAWLVRGCRWFMTRLRAPIFAAAELKVHSVQAHGMI